MLKANLSLTRRQIQPKISVHFWVKLTGALNGNLTFFYLLAVILSFSSHNSQFRISENYLMCLIVLKKLLFKPNTSDWAQSVLKVFQNEIKILYFNFNTFKGFLNFDKIRQIRQKMGIFVSSVWISENLKCGVKQYAYISYFILNDEV